MGSFKLQAQRVDDREIAHRLPAAWQNSDIFMGARSADGQWRSTRAAYTPTSPYPSASISAATHWCHVATDCTDRPRRSGPQAVQPDAHARPSLCPDRTSRFCAAVSTRPAAGFRSTPLRRFRPVHGTGRRRKRHGDRWRHVGSDHILECTPTSLVVVQNLLFEFRVRHGTVFQLQCCLTTDVIHHSADHGVRRLIADVSHPVISGLNSCSSERAPSCCPPVCAGSAIIWRANHSRGCSSYTVSFSAAYSSALNPGNQRSKVFPQVVVEDLYAGLQQQMCAALGPAHLLLLHKALADHIVHGGFD
jgi:hypothetical protein